MRSFKDYNGCIPFNRYLPRAYFVPAWTKTSNMKSDIIFWRLLQAGSGIVGFYHNHR